MQEQLFKAIAERYKGAEAKKINKDNYLDIYLPTINSNRGTHLFFNTVNYKIKIGFYVRDEKFIYSVLENGINVERYSQGIRIAGNPSYSDVNSAIEAAFEFLSIFPGNKIEKDKTDDENSTIIQNFIKYYIDDLPDLCDELMKSYEFEPSKMGVYTMSKSLLSDAVDEAGNMILEKNMFNLEGLVNLNDWDSLSDLIGVSESDENIKLYSDESFSSDAKIVFIYSDGNYVYSFLDKGGEDD